MKIGQVFGALGAGMVAASGARDAPALLDRAKAVRAAAVQDALNSVDVLGWRELQQVAATQGHAKQKQALAEIDRRRRIGRNVGDAT